MTSHSAVNPGRISLSEWRALGRFLEFEIRNSGDTCTRCVDPSSRRTSADDQHLTDNADRLRTRLYIEYDRLVRKRSDVSIDFCRAGLIDGFLEFVSGI